MQFIIAHSLKHQRGASLQKENKVESLAKFIICDL